MLLEIMTYQKKPIQIDISIKINTFNPQSTKTTILINQAMVVYIFIPSFEQILPKHVAFVTYY
jgi:hypothetical protein